MTFFNSLKTPDNAKAGNNKIVNIFFGGFQKANHFSETFMGDVTVEDLFGGF
jgi:hypothetical protein